LETKSTGDRYDAGDNNGLSHHLVAIFAAAIVILIIAGGIILSEAAKNPAPVPSKTPGERDLLYQVSTIDALVIDFTPPDTPVTVIIDQTPDFSMSAP
jgi:hypothetical protein